MRVGADSGRIVIQSATTKVLIGLRLLNPTPEAAAEFKAALMSRLGEEPRPIRFVEGLDREWSATPPRGMAYWECLAAILAEEPVSEVNKIMIAMLEPLGIVKGHPFNPDARQTRLLTEAAALGELMMHNNQINPRYASPCWKSTSWFKSFDFHTSQETDVKLQLHERSTWFYEAVTSSN